MSWVTLNPFRVVGSLSQNRSVPRGSPRDGLEPRGSRCIPWSIPRSIITPTSHARGTPPASSHLPSLPRRTPARQRSKRRSQRHRTGALSRLSLGRKTFTIPPSSRALPRASFANMAAQVFTASAASHSSCVGRSRRAPASTISRTLRPLPRPTTLLCISAGCQHYEWICGICRD